MKHAWDTLVEGVVAFGAFIMILLIVALKIIGAVLLGCFVLALAVLALPVLLVCLPFLPWIIRSALNKK